MNECNFYSPKEIRPMFDSIVPVYQVAFAGSPWYEVSKCVDAEQRCLSGLSSLSIGTMCNTCGGCPNQPAYEADELIARFETIGQRRPTVWYIEKTEGEIALAALAWRASPGVIAREKYAQQPQMEEWLELTLQNQTVGWLDEVFADRTVRPEGNLKNFDTLCRGVADALSVDTVAYRTKSPQMTRAAKRDFRTVRIFSSRKDDVPDERDFVTIRARYDTPKVVTEG